MRELACSFEAVWSQRVGWGGEHVPVGVGAGVSGWVDGLSAVEEPGVVAIPGVAFDWESVGCVRGSLVVAVNHLDVLELVAGVIHSRVGLSVDVRHAAPIISVRGALARVEDEAIDSSAVNGA